MIALIKASSVAADSIHTTPYTQKDTAQDTGVSSAGVAIMLFCLLPGSGYGKCIQYKKENHAITGKETKEDG